MFFLIFFPSLNHKHAILSIFKLNAYIFDHVTLPGNWLKTDIIQDIDQVTLPGNCLQYDIIQDIDHVTLTGNSLKPDIIQDTDHVTLPGNWFISLI